LCLEYYRDGDSLVLGSGCSLPVAVSLQSDGSELRVVGHRVPRDGGLFADDVRAIFPRNTWPPILHTSPQETEAGNERVQGLEAEIWQRAQAFYEPPLRDG
jgi:hypothetical protein